MLTTTRIYTFVVMSLFFSAIAEPVAAQTIITHVPRFTFNENSERDGFGSSVSGAGDVNGDGFADVIVGAPFNVDDSGTIRGGARVLSGIDGSVLYNINGDDAGDGFGRSVSGAGDVNGDGFADVIVGALTDDNNGNQSGSARVLSGVDGSVLYNVNGVSADARFGRSVSNAGDVNGDGFADVIVGAFDDNRLGLTKGNARVLSGLDGSVLYSFRGEGIGDEFGHSVSGVGDVNGDGFADVIVGAPFDDNNGERSGSALVLSGVDGSVLHNFNGERTFIEFGSSVSGAGDVNGDGFADMIVGARGPNLNGGRGSAHVLSGVDGSVLYNFYGDSPDDFGHSVSGAGDVNGDGFADVIVGAPFNVDDGGIRSGSARVLSGIDGSVLYNFNGDFELSYFGTSVSGAGDVNGDGIADFIVGAPDFTNEGNSFARVFVSQISLLGDVNQDDVVNFLDIGPFVAALSFGNQTEADINQDGTVDFLDIGPFIALFVG